MKAVYISPEDIGTTRYTQQWVSFVNFIYGTTYILQTVPDHVSVVPFN